MDYLDSAKKVYDTFESTNFKKLLGGYFKDYDKVFASLEEKFGFNELRKSYVDDIQVAIDNYLPFFKDDLKKFLQLKEVTYYQKNIPLRTLLLLMWIWEKKLDISKNALHKFVDSLFLGTFGYKMIDFNGDNKNTNPEVSLVGFYSIKLAEKLLAEVFGYTNTQEAIAKYFSMYIETELFEKKNRWKKCPFSWNEAARLGNKSAPIYAVHESLFNYEGYDSKIIKDLIDSLIYVSASIQLIDDLADAKQDLSNGYETLVMSGYYKTFGTESEVTDEKINYILTQERLKLIYRTGQDLFDKSRTLFEKHDEFVIQLNAEMWNFNFTTLFKID
jgi:hypothetical protein